MTDKRTPTNAAPGGFDPALIEKLRQDSQRDDGVNPGRKIPDVPLAKHVNHTPFWSQYYQSVDSQGEVFHTVVTRVSLDMKSVPRGQGGGQGGSGNGNVLAYCAEQSELAMGDEHANPEDPEHSELLWESDFCAYKPKCDVLLINAATRPGPSGLGDWARIALHRNPDLMPQAQRWACGIALEWTDDNNKAQKWHKRVAVTGPRRMGLLNAKDPQAASEVLLSWHKAFGGPQDERNPLGVGHSSSESDWAPQQEVAGKPYRGGVLQGDYPPASFGPVGKTWLPRRTQAGTYNNDWLKTQWPLPPKDFDHAYWNCAPADQQIDYPSPGAEITLLNIWPPLKAGQTPAPASEDTEVWRARLPRHQLFVRLVVGYIDDEGERRITSRENDQVLDTLVVNLQTQRIEATFRYRLGQAELMGRLRLLGVHTMMNPVGRPDEPVPKNELGPLG